MKRILLFALAMLALAGCVTTPREPIEPIPPPPETGRAEWLLGRIKAVADEGALFEPDKVARLLSLSLKPGEAEMRAPFSNCGNPYDGSSETRHYVPQEPNWYFASPEGVPHMQRPGFTINPPAVMRDPAFSYSVSKHKSCTGRSEPKEYTDARIDFSYISGYACITPQVLNRVLPQAEEGRGTDGAMPYFYSGKFDDRTWTKVNFSFFFGTECLIGVTIDQSEMTGKRFLRARSKFQECKRQAELEYCSGREPFSWSEGDKIEAMDNFAFGKCGTMNSYFQKEPLSGEEPPPVPRHTWSPCDLRSR